MVKTTWFKLFLVTEQMVKGILFLVHFLKINNVNFDLWEIGVWSSSYSSIYWELVLIKRWVIEVHGAPGTLYANESYQLQVDFPEHYPMEAPQVAKNIIKICISFFFFFFLHALNFHLFLCFLTWLVSLDRLFFCSRLLCTLIFIAMVIFV